MNYEIAIISTQKEGRSGALLTLDMLRGMRVPNERVSLFVAPREMDAYRGFADVGYNVVAGASGLAANRRKSLEHYEPGTPVLALDDDLVAIRTYEEYNGRFRPVNEEQFNGLIEEGFRSLDEWNAALWGILHTQHNVWAARYPELQVGMIQVEGPVFGFIAGTEGMAVADGLEWFEDVERLCQLYETGKEIVRHNRFSYKVALQHERVAKGTEACEDVRRIERLYPHLMEHSTGKMIGKQHCRVRVRPGRWASNPTSRAEVQMIRDFNESERGRWISDEIHGQEDA